MTGERDERAKDPKDASKWDAVEEATELLHEERFHDALLELRDVLKRDPDNAYAFHFLGVALFESGELEAARDAYRACLRLAPRYLGSKVALSHVLRTLGDLRPALKEGMDALEISPEDGDALHAVGLAYLARGDTVAATKYLSEFLGTRPEFEVGEEVRAILLSIEQGGGVA